MKAVKTTTKKTNSKKAAATVSPVADIDTLINQAPVNVHSKVEIGGKQYPLLFNNQSLVYYMDFLVEKRLANSMGILTPAQVAVMIRAGISNYDYINETTTPLSLEQIHEAVEIKLDTEEGKAELDAIYSDFGRCKASLKLSKSFGQPAA